MLFLPKSGTIECADSHRENGDMKILLNRSSLTALRHTVYADDNKLVSFALPERDLDVLNEASENYVKYMFEMDFSTLNFYKTIS